MSLRDIPSGVVAVTPSDANDLPKWAVGLSCQVSGNVSIIDFNGNTTTIALAAGVPFPIRVKRVRATGTTATGISAIYSTF